MFSLPLISVSLLHLSLVVSFGFIASCALYIFLYFKFRTNISAFFSLLFVFSGPTFVLLHVAVVGVLDS